MREVVEVAVVVVMEDQSLFQVGDQNGSDLELDTIHGEDYRLNSRTARSCDGP